MTNKCPVKPEKIPPNLYGTPCGRRYMRRDKYYYCNREIDCEHKLRAECELIVSEKYPIYLISKYINKFKKLVMDNIRPKKEEWGLPLEGILGEENE